ncbi:hypothetical protein [Yinghuangia seranimata]|uniref:hypothetical protein n=1 Tax=Yinghuangia seranimata TaxID=408067 RepID=UPI00248B4E67|nr:hypothetical protein [Yinghuangia seranimata]MDI2129025.1 hypothetical protein [Yinghuangia seranimata]
MSRALDAALTELAARAVFLDDVRSAKTAEFTLDCQELDALLAPAEQLDAPVLDQCKAILAAFNTARATVGAVEAEIPALQAALDAAAQLFDARFNDAHTLASAGHEVKFYGPAALFALSSMKHETVSWTFTYLEDPARESRFRRTYPADTPQDTLLAAYKRVSVDGRTYQSKPGYQRVDRVNSAQ